MDNNWCSPTTIDFRKTWCSVYPWTLSRPADLPPESQLRRFRHGSSSLRHALSTTDILRGARPLDGTPTLSTDSQPVENFPPRRTPAHRRTSTPTLQLWIYKILLIIFTLAYLGTSAANAAHSTRLHGDTTARSNCPRLVSDYPWRAEELAAGGAACDARSAAVARYDCYNFSSHADLSADEYNLSSSADMRADDYDNSPRGADSFAPVDAVYGTTCGIYRGAQNSALGDAVYGTTCGIYRGAENFALGDAVCGTTCGIYRGAGKSALGDAVYGTFFAAFTEELGAKKLALGGAVYDTMSSCGRRQFF